MPIFIYVNLYYNLMLLAMLAGSSWPTLRTLNLFSQFCLCNFFSNKVYNFYAPAHKNQEELYHQRTRYSPGNNSHSASDLA